MHFIDIIDILYSEKEKENKQNETIINGKYCCIAANIQTTNIYPWKTQAEHEKNNKIK